MMAARSFAGARGYAQPDGMKAHRKWGAALRPCRFSKASVKGGGRRAKLAGKGPLCPEFVSKKQKDLA
jgi:hypothetical protein